MDVYHICHSTWVVVDCGLALLFDYSEKICGKRVRHEAASVIGGLHTIALFSHSHADHYDTRVSHLSEIKLYVLPPDLPDAPLQPSIRVPYEGIVHLPRGITLKTHPSTDEGVAYLLRGPGGGCIFFAGDLARWRWPEDSPGEQERMERSWNEALKKIGEEGIDVAFLVADPRLKDRGGFMDALKRLRPRYTFPIHNFGTYEHLKDFEGTEGVLIPSQPGERFTIDVRF